MRINVKKYIFIGPKEDKEKFFKKSQEIGIIDFIDPKPSSHKELPQEIQNITAAIKILRHLPPIDQEENFSLFNPEVIVHDILKLNEQNEKLLEELRVLKLEIARVEMYGDYSKEDIEYIEKEGVCKVQFFCARPSLFQEMPMPEALIFIASEHNLNYYVAINPQPVNYERMVEIKIDHPVGELRKKYATVQNQQLNSEHRLKEYGKFNKFLHHVLIANLNKYHLFNVQNYVQEVMEDTLFAIEGWVPENHIREMERIIEPMHVYAEEIAIEPTDVVPTYLENEGFKRVGEDLVHIYDTPSPLDKDPSLWVLGSFALFFSFIIGDAGYGLIYLAIALFLRYKFPQLKGVGKRVLNLFTILAIGCVIWGTLMTSFFGMQIAPDNPLRKISLIHWLASKKAAYHFNLKDETYQEWVKKHPQLLSVSNPEEFLTYVPSGEEGGTPVLTRFSDNIMFELALFIGVLHIILSLARYAGRNWQNVGWIAFLIGGYLYFSSYLDAPGLPHFVGGIDLKKGGEFGLWLLIVGISFAWVVSIIRNGFSGVFEIMNLIQVFADILSYLRLYALGLAGAIVSSTVNDIAHGAPIFVAVLLVLLAHFINIILGTMSGVIHGLRLNFIEWYHYSFEGGGRRFKPLKLIKIE